MQSFFAGVKINVLIIAIVSYCVQLRFSKNLAVFHVDMDHLERKASSSRVMTVNKTILAMCEVSVCCAIGRRKCLDVHNKKFLQRSLVHLISEHKLIFFPPPEY